MFLEYLVQLDNTVDHEGKSRSGSDLGFHKVAILVDIFDSVEAFQISSGGDGLAVYGPGGSIEYMEQSFSDGIPGILNLFLCSFCNRLAQIGDPYSALIITLAPVGIDGLAIQDALCSVGVVWSPFDRGTGCSFQPRRL